MNQKIFAQLMDATRGLGLAQSASASLALQLLCWWKLSHEPTSLPQELRLPRLLDRQLAELREALRQVQSHARFHFIDESVWQSLHGGGDISPLLRKIASLEEQGFLDRLKLDDVAFWSLDRHDGGIACSPGLYDLMMALAGIEAAQTVYIPWESTGQLAARVTRSGARAWVESQMPVLPAQVLTLTDCPNWELRVAEPISAPVALEKGRLIRFDAAISHPPMGLRYPHDIAESDLFDRFVEKTPVGNVLQIRHLLAQTRGRIVVAVSNSVLFASGSERQLRERLVEAGQLEAVIAFPAGLCLNTNLALSVLVLNAHGGAGTVRFVNATSEAFSTTIGKRRVELNNLDALLAEVAGRESTEHAVSIQAEAIADNDYSLEVGRYVLDDTARKLQATLARYKTCRLGDFFEIIRPRQHSTAASGARVFEVQAQDLPAFGCIASASKESLFDLGSAKAANYFVRPNDVLVTIKGTIGKVGMAAEVPDAGEGGWVAGQSMAVLRGGRPDVYPPKALVAYLRSAMGQAQLNRAAVGATVPSIQLSALKDLEVPLPSRDALQKMVEVFDQETQIEEQIQQLRLKQAGLAAGLWT